jgi:hypothetical protein
MDLSSEAEHQEGKRSHQEVAAIGSERQKSNQFPKRWSYEPEDDEIFIAV